MAADTRDSTALQSQPDPLRRSLDAIGIGLAVIDFDWRYVYVNSAAAAHAHRTPQMLIGRSLQEVYPGIEQTPLFDALQRCMTTSRPTVLDELLVYTTGDKRWFSVKVEPTEEGLCVYSMDIHERKTREIALAERNQDLERQHASLIERLKTMGRTPNDELTPSDTER